MRHAADVAEPLQRVDGARDARRVDDEVLAEVTHRHLAGVREAQDGERLVADVRELERAQRDVVGLPDEVRHAIRREGGPEPRPVHPALAGPVRLGLEDRVVPRARRRARSPVVGRLDVTGVGAHAGEEVEQLAGPRRRRGRRARSAARRASRTSAARRAGPSA